MAALASPALLASPAAAAPSHASGVRAQGRSSTATAVRISPFSRVVRRRCVPRQTFSPGHVRVIFAHEAFPSQQQPAGDGAPAPAQAANGQQQQDQQQENEDASTQQQQQQQQQSGQWSSQRGWKQQRWSPWSSSCNPNNACSPTYADMADMLSPWFPANRSLAEMLSTADRMLGDFMLGRASSAAGAGGGAGARWGPEGLLSLAMRRPWDAAEDAAGYTLRLDLPGMGREDVRVRVDDEGVLLIAAEKKPGEGEEAGVGLRGSAARGKAREGSAAAATRQRLRRRLGPWSLPDSDARSPPWDPARAQPASP